jgi:hypothetical protein
MQPTDVQVQRTLAALEVPADSSDSVHGRIPRDTLEILLRELPDGLLADLEDEAPMRSDRLERARTLLADGNSPSDDELAGRIVGRLVCDRLR